MMRLLVCVVAMCSLSVACKNRDDAKLESVGYYFDAESLRFGKSIGFITERRPDKESPIASMLGATGFVIADLDNNYIGMTNRHVWNTACKKECYIAFPKGNDFSDWETFRLFPYVEDVNGLKQQIISKPNHPGTDEEPQGDYALFQFEKNSEAPLVPLLMSMDPIPERAVINIFGYPSGVYRTEDAEKIIEESTSPALFWSRGVAMNVLQDHFVGTAQSRHGNSGSPVFIWHDGTRVAVGINFGGPHTESKQEANSPRSAHRAAVAADRNVGNLFSLIRKAYPDLELWKKMANNLVLEQQKVAVASDLTKLMTNFTAVPVHAGQDGVHESGYRVSATFMDKPLHNLDGLFFSGAPAKFFDEFRFDSASNNVSFLIPATLMDPYSYIEFEVGNTEVMFAGCSYLDLSGFMQVRFSNEFQEFLQDQANPKWGAPKYKELKQFLQQWDQPESKVKRLRCTTESAIFAQMAKVFFKPYEH